MTKKRPSERKRGALLPHIASEEGDYFPNTEENVAKVRDSLNGTAVDVTTLTEDDYRRICRALEHAMSIAERRTAPMRGRDAFNYLDKIERKATELHSMLTPLRQGDTGPMEDFLVQVLSRHMAKIEEVRFGPPETRNPPLSLMELIRTGLRYLSNGITAAAADEIENKWILPNAGRDTAYIEVLMAEIEEFIFKPRSLSLTYVTPIDGSPRRSDLAEATYTLAKLLPSELWPRSLGTVIKVHVDRRARLTSKTSSTKATRSDRA